MKYIVPLLFFCVFSFSQTNDLIGRKKTNNKAYFSLKLDSLSKTKPVLNIDFKIGKADVLSVYDRNTKLNDVYFYSKDSFYFVKTVNQFNPKDSFNPYESSDLGCVLIMGTINTVLNLFD